MEIISITEKDYFKYFGAIEKVCNSVLLFSFLTEDKTRFTRPDTCTYKNREVRIISIVFNIISNVELK